MSKNLPIGEILVTPEAKDAIHVAVAPVIAAHNISPGTHVQLTPDGRAACGPNPIGIVDPFLKFPVIAGQRFWLFLYPGTITSLRHDWSHPAFEVMTCCREDNLNTTPVANSLAIASEKWLRDFAEQFDLTYNRLMAAAEEWVRSKAAGGYGEYYVGGSEMEGQYVPDEFWMHYQIVKGIAVPEAHQGSFFSCSC